MYNPLFFQDENRILYYLKDGKYYPLQLPITVRGGGRSGLSQSQVINLINQFIPSNSTPLLTAKLSLTATTHSLNGAPFVSGGIQTLLSNPILIVPSPGIGKAIQTISISSSFKWGTVQYTNTNLMIIANGLAITQAQKINLLNRAQDTFTSINQGSDGSNQPNIKENSDLMVTANADSVVGDSTMDVYVAYRIITL